MSLLINETGEVQKGKAPVWVKFCIVSFVLLFVAVGILGWLEHQKIMFLKADVSHLTKNPITDKYDANFERLSKAVSEQGTKIEPLEKGMGSLQAKIEKIDSRLVALEKKAKGSLPPAKK